MNMKGKSNHNTNLIKKNRQLGNSKRLCYEIIQSLSIPDNEKEKLLTKVKENLQ